MSQSNQSEPTSKIPWHKTPEGKARRKEIDRAYRQTPEYKAIQKAYRQTPEYKAIQKAYQQTPEYKAKQKAYQQTPEVKAQQKAYQQTPEFKAQQKAWKKANPKKVLSINKAYHEKRLKRDPLYASKCKLRVAVTCAFRRIGKHKPTDTRTLLGCNWEEAKAHIESLFKEGMSWENHGEWHIDHIRPATSFTEEDLHLMNHISNLQPLWAEENWEKSNKIL